MFVELLNNAVYLLALGVIYDVLELRIIRDKQSRQALTGIFIGLISDQTWRLPRLLQTLGSV